MSIPYTHAEIDLDNIVHNIRALKRAARPDAAFMAVVKANAYGHGATEVARCALANGADALGVARISEGVALREAGLSAPILIFGYTPPEMTETLIRHDLIQTVFDITQARACDNAAGRAKKKLKIHLKIDTGMCRLGFSGHGADIPYNPPEFIRHTQSNVKSVIQLPHLETAGIYTHFRSADHADITEARHQLELFLALLSGLKKQGIDFKTRHAANSAAIMALPDAHLDMVRAGIALYGLYPSETMDRQKITLRPAMTLKSSIIRLMTVPGGTPVSYGGTYRTPGPTRIATVPAGYGDGLNRRLSNTGEMLVNGKRARIAGRVCMDLTMLDVGHIEGVACGDEVVLIGCQGDARITADEIAGLLGTINYEITTAVSARVPRISNFTPVLK